MSQPLSGPASAPQPPSATLPDRHRNGALGVIAVPEAEGEVVAVVGAAAAPRPPRYRVSVGEYTAFREQGFLIVPGLVDPAEVDELRAHTEDLIWGRVTVPGLEPPPPGASVAEIERRYLRIHMLHRQLAIHERFLLHPRILDVLEALIGPDVMAMQSMLFLKPPGGAGQGYHQDSYYIPTYPDTLCGAWLAIDRADEENGCLWVTVGSQQEPIYPSPELGDRHHGDVLADLTTVDQVSHTDETVNGLTPIAAKYGGREVAAIVEPGDVIFFGGHVLHRSHQNRSPDRFRRSFVGHYAHARSFTRWGRRAGEPTNQLQILARGGTHLPFGQPRFGTPCAANQAVTDETASGAPADMMPTNDGLMERMPTAAERDDPRRHQH